MIAIYGRSKKEDSDMLMDLTSNALNELSETIRRIEERGGCAAAERVRLESLRLALARARQPRIPQAPVH